MGNKRLLGLVLLGTILITLSLASAYTSSNFLAGQGISLNPLQVDDNFCSPGQDFLVQVAPLGCSPTVVRSDLLEEQNVPVFCQLAATQINPLIDVGAIESLSFRGDIPAEVSGVGFHPARAALSNSRSSLLSSPVLNNIGYAVIVLKQQPVEAEMPDFVEGTLTARLKYDVDNAFGIGRASMYLPELSEEDWDNTHEQYGFWKQKGFLRAERVGGALTGTDSAVIGLYVDNDQKIRTINLNKGQTSNLISLPGANFCSAGLKIRLDGLENPDTFARIRINGDSFSVRDNQKFLDNKCSVTDLDKDGIVQRVGISCRTDDGTERFSLSLSPSFKIDIDGTPEDYSVGDKLFETDEGKSVYLSHADLIEEKGGKGIKNVLLYLQEKSGELKESDFRLASSRSKNFKEKNKAIEDDSFFIVDKEETFSGKKIKLLDYSVSGVGDSEKENSKVKDFSLSYHSALEDFTTVSGDYPNLKKTDKDKSTFGEKALIAAIELARDTSNGGDVLELCEDFLESYGNKNLPLVCKNSYKLSNKEILTKSVLLNGLVRTISLEGISEPKEEDYSATIEIKGPNGNIDSVVLSKNEFLDLGEYRKEDDKEDEFIQLVSLSNGSARLQVSLGSKSTGQNSGTSTISGTKTLKEDVVESFGSEYNFVLQDVQLNKIAKVSILPEVQNQGGEANFTFKIGIEKRAIQLSPEKIEERLQSVGEQIATWGNVSETLGKTVKGFKAACFATGSYLTVKNFFQNSGGKSLARQEVMRGDGGWVETCKLEVEGTSKSLDSCLLSKNSEIEADVNALSKIISDQESVTDENKENTLERIRNSLTNENENEFSDPFPGLNSKPISLEKDSNVYNALSSEGEDRISLRDTRDLERWSKILEDGSSSSQLKSISRRNIYKKLSEIDANANSLGERNKIAKLLNMDASDLDVQVESDSEGFIYRGRTKSDLPSKIKNKMSGIGDDQPVGIVKVNGLWSIIVLENPVGNKNIMAPKTEKINNNIKQFVYGTDGNRIENSDFNLHYKKFDRTSYDNKFKITPEVRYFETAPYKGLPSQVPFNIEKGWYVSVKQTVSGFGKIRSYDDSGAPSSFKICNVGSNGIPEAETGRDTCTIFNPGTGQIVGTFPGLDSKETGRLVNEAIDALEEAGSQYKPGVRKVRINGENLNVGNPSANIPDVQCQDFMSPKDCNLFFNTCDPVICPSSRCNLGGNYHVDNVIQSGIVGSIAMCLPNAGEVAVPICLSGVNAGVESLLSVYESYEQCLQEQLDTGRTVGICDEIYSINLCEFFWRQGVPVAKAGVPFLVNSLTGNSNQGGGEYLGFNDAWSNAEGSVDFMVNYYGANSLESFRARSTEEAGSEVCKAFISARYPSNVEFLDTLLEPDSPTQFTANFDEIPFTTATVPPTSQYKVFYHIFAGNDAGVYYNVYLKSPEGSSYYQTNPIYTVSNGYIPRGEFSTETLDFTATSGFSKLCVSVNGKEECGFKEVTTSFALNYVNDKYLEEQASKKDIKSEAECVSGSPSLYGLVNANLQEGVNDAINPELYNQGIVRVCSTDNPGLGTNPLRWEKVGTCDGQVGNFGCYIDKESVKDVIKFRGIEESTLDTIGQNLAELEETYLSETEFEEKVSEINLETDNDKKIDLIKKIMDKVLFGKQKAELFLLRGKAWAAKAVKLNTENKAGEPKTPESPEIEGEDETEDVVGEDEDEVKVEGENGGDETGSAGEEVFTYEIKSLKVYIEGEELEKDVPLDGVIDIEVAYSCPNIKLMLVVSGEDRELQITNGNFRLDISEMASLGENFRFEATCYDEEDNLRNLRDSSPRVFTLVDSN